MTKPAPSYPLIAPSRESLYDRPSLEAGHAFLRVLVVGTGAREHAIAWSLARSDRVTSLLFAPGNAGTADLGQNVDHVDPRDPQAVTALARENQVDLAVIGPEDALAAGAVDALSSAGIACIGPNRSATRLESSKLFAKQLMREQSIATARSDPAHDLGRVEQLLEEMGTPGVLKRDGLAQGKGVLVSDDHSELVQFARVGLEHGPVLVEECLEGGELSQLVLLDGENAVSLPLCSDYKRAFDGDVGPNTGGMGCVCPVPSVSADLRQSIDRDIVERTIAGMRRRGLMFHGMLFIGIIVTPSGPKVLEYNVRFGDPETQALLPLLRTDLAEVLLAVANGTLDQVTLEWRPASATVVVIAADGYPAGYATGLRVEPLPAVDVSEGVIFHAGTRRHTEGAVPGTATAGGRCFAATGLGPTLATAVANAYRLAADVRFPGAWHRSDIGRQFLGTLG